MTSLASLYLSHPAWIWLAVGAVILAAEVATGSGWLLWPAACAGLLAGLNLVGLKLGVGGDVALFSVLAIASSLLARRFAPGWSQADSDDINDRAGGLIGQVGVATSPFVDGDGRILVSGAEWAAEVDDGGDVAIGAKLRVAVLMDGARLRVTRA